MKANGLKYYYEISGKGEPLLLLHGGLGSIDMFKPIMPAFTEHRQVIADRPAGSWPHRTLGRARFSLPDLGDDVAAVLTQLGFKNVDVMGYSFGGGVAFRLAVQHPDMVRRLALGIGGLRLGWFLSRNARAAEADQCGLRGADESRRRCTRRTWRWRQSPMIFRALLQAMGDLMREHVRLLGGRRRSSPCPPC